MSKLEKFEFTLPSHNIDDKYISDCIQEWFKNTLSSRHNSVIKNLKDSIDSNYLRLKLFDIEKKLLEKDGLDSSMDENCTFDLVYSDLKDGGDYFRSEWIEDLMFDLRGAIICKKLVNHLTSNNINVISRALRICSKPDSILFLQNNLKNLAHIEKKRQLVSLYNNIKNDYVHIVYASLIEANLQLLNTEQKIIVTHRSPKHSDTKYDVGQIILNYKNNNLFILTKKSENRATWETI